MAQEFADALKESGFDVIDVFDGNVALSLQDVEIHGEQFDEVELMVGADLTRSDGPLFGVVDVWRADNELTEAHEAVLDEVGRPDDGGAVYEIESEELDNFAEIANAIREVYRSY